MTDDERRLDRAVGALEGEVKTLRSTWQEQDRAATEGRRQLHNKFDELKDETIAALHGMQIRLSEVTNTMATIVSQMAEIRPQLLTSNNERHQQIGSRRALGKAWGALIGLVTAAGTIGAGLMELIHYLAGPPHH